MRAAGSQSEESMRQSSSHPQPTWESCAPLHVTAAWPAIFPTYLDTQKSTFLRMLTESLLVKSCNLCPKSRNKNNFAPTFFLFKGFKIAFSKYKTSYSSIQHKNLCAKLQGTETFYKKARLKMVVWVVLGVFCFVSRVWLFLRT